MPTKRLLVTIDILVGQCLAKPSSEKLSPAVDRNKCRDTQLDYVQRVRGLETFIPKWEVSI